MSNVKNNTEPRTLGPQSQISIRKLNCIMIAKDVLTALLVASTVFAQPDKPRWEPIPICDDCVPRELIVAPGVGIDLTSSYG